MRGPFAALLSSVLLALPTGAAPAEPTPGLEAILPDLEALYVELHRDPELSLQEERTAARLAARLRTLGFEVMPDVGGHGVVGVLANGPGPTVMLRTDLDGLPVEERTGLPHASRAQAVTAAGERVFVMHACGHDVHMASWIGAATLLSRSRNRWRGTLLMVGQPAEELGNGARAMLDAGLYERFPRPDAAFAIHVSADLPAGTAGYSVGPALASADSVDVTIRGRGGHGAYPHRTVDPIVIAARVVLALQTIVSRENNPLDPAVVTVGSIHGGTKHNIIPDEVRLQLTVRAYKQEVRDRLLAAIERIVTAEAAAAGAPVAPTVAVAESTPATHNDPGLTRRVAAALGRSLGSAAVLETPPVMGAEDFSEYGRAGVPAAIFWVGAVEPGKHAEAKATGAPLPSLHSPLFAPDRETLHTGVAVMTLAALELLARP